MTTVLNSVFLSGWEYNRLLAADPLAPRLSSLPAEVLWNGSSHFWLFEKVYCSKESLEAEHFCDEELHWASGNMFCQLEEAKILEPIDLQKLGKNDPSLRAEMIVNHEKLKSKHNVDDLRHLIESRRVGQLDDIKSTLLSPIMARKNCAQYVSPNSITYWMKGDASESTSRIQRDATRLLAAPVEKRNAPWPYLPLSRSPKEATSRADFLRQKTFTNRVEKPIITDLILGLGTHAEYVSVVKKAIARTGNVYEPANGPMRIDFKDGLTALKFIRDQADKYLWRELHSQWLPSLKDGSMSLSEFSKAVSFAIRQVEPRLVDRAKSWGRTALPSLVGLGVLTLAKHYGPKFGIDDAYAGRMATDAHNRTDRILSESHRAKVDNVRNLIVFYQSLKKGKIEREAVNS